MTYRETERPTDNGTITTLVGTEHTIYVSRVRSQPGRWFVVVSVWRADGSEDKHPLRLWPPALRGNLVASPEGLWPDQAEPLPTGLSKREYDRAIEHARTLMTSAEAMTDGT